MISDFEPRVEVGSEYKASDGEIYRVKDFLCNLGNIPDTVVFVNIKDESVEFEAGFEEWNTRQFKRVGSAPINDGGVKNGGEASPIDEDNKSKGKTTDDSPKGDSKDNPDSSSTSVEDQYSPDSKIKELSELLETGPKQFNQKFFPTDESLPENNIIDKEAEEAFQKTLDGIEEQRGRGRSLKGTISKISEFLWICAGVDRDLLRTCATDWAKKVGLGGTILATAVLATLSMGYAALTVASIGADEHSIYPYFIALFVGIVWGLVIFNLDRYLVNSMYSDGKSTISKEEIKSGLPRIIIAFFLGIVISTPIEMRIFEDRINKVIVSDNEKYEDSHQTRDLSLFNETAKRYEDDYKKADNDLTILQKCIVAEEQGLLYDRSTGEILKDNNGVPMKNPRGHGAGAEYKSLKNREPQLTHYRDSLKNVFDQYKNNESTLVENSLKNSRDDLTKQQGFSQRLGIMLRETSIFQHPNEPLSWARLLIAALFIILEILPVINKMMQENGQYDKILILESNTREQLERIKEYNNINILRPSNLGYYVNAIIGREIKEDEDHNEGVNAFVKKDIKRENKDETERDNQEIYRYARQRAKEHVMRQIDLIFGIPTTDHVAQASVSTQSKTQQTINKDASDEAETING